MNKKENSFADRVALKRNDIIAIIDDQTNNNWADYYLRTKNAAPSALLRSALPYVKQRGSAIDLGAGALRETRLLLDLGFSVTVVDKEPAVAREIAVLLSRNVKYFMQSFDDFTFPFETYDLAVAINSLPFSPPDTFHTMFARLKRSLNIGAIFCGTLFGPNDDWNKPDRIMTFLTRSAVNCLFDDMDLIRLDEREYVGQTAAGIAKRWHLFKIIARKERAQ